MALKIVGIVCVAIVLIGLVFILIFSTDSNKEVKVPENLTGLSESEACKKIEKKEPKTLEDMATLTKLTKAKPSLVSTGMKCYLDPNTYLELSVRSSCPLKSWLILANGVGVIDRDYVDNADNEGEIFFQLINLSPYEILLRRGDIIGQGIIKPYLTVDNDEAKKERVGGFGSTSK